MSDDDRRAYARSLVQACRQKALDAIAITDHHDLVFAPLVRAAAEAERNPEGNLYPPEERLIVFPGLELTLNVPCQALLLFDANFPDDMLPLVLTALTLPTTGGAAAKAPDPKRLDHIPTLERLREELDKHEFLRGRYIVLPNVSDSPHSFASERERSEVRVDALRRRLRRWLSE